MKKKHEYWCATVLVLIYALLASTTFHPKEVVVWSIFTGVFTILTITFLEGPIVELPKKLSTFGKIMFLGLVTIVAIDGARNNMFRALLLAIPVGSFFACSMVLMGQKNWKSEK